MKKIKICILLLLPFFCIACEEEDYYAITYYDVVGEGYIFYYDSLGVLQPVVGARISVATLLLGGGGLFSVTSPAMGIYYTDTTGKYVIKFIKRTHKRDASLYTIYIEYSNYTYYSRKFDIEVKKVENTKKILKIDTIKYDKKL